MKHDTSAHPESLPDYTIDWGQSPIVEHTEWLGEGDYCRCYLVNAGYVFRYAKHEAASQAMDVERCVLPLLKGYFDVAVPELLFAGSDTATGYGVVGYRLLEGDHLERAIVESLPMEHRTTLIMQMAGFARQLHAFPVALAADCTIPVLDPLQHLTQVMEHASRTLRPRVSHAVWRYHEGLFDSYARQARRSSYRRALLHGDLSPDHFLGDTQQPRLTGVLDFGDACIGDPAWDLIYIYEDYGEQIFQEFLEHYNPAAAWEMSQNVRVFQQLNNIAYCAAVLKTGDEADIQEAIDILTKQAHR